MPDHTGGTRTQARPQVPRQRRWGIGRDESAPTNGTRKTDLSEIRTRVHRKLLDRLNLSNLDRVDRAQVMDTIRSVVKDLIAADAIPLNVEEREALTGQILDEIFGLGPLQPLMEDTTVSDILVNTFDSIDIEREGKLESTEIRFQDDAHLMQVIDRIVSSVGRRIDDSSPMVDARLADGSRVNAVIPPLAVDGPHLSIRRFKEDVLEAPDLVRLKTLTEPMVTLLQGVVTARLNILISGGTGAGKTTLLNILSSFISKAERVITIEDSAELRLRQPRVVRLETRTANVEGEGAVTQRQLVINALRMRPDRIIVGEVRGEESVDMLQAMNTGHQGSMTTLHANSPRDALSRLETIVAMANLNLPEKAVRQQIASAFDLVIQVNRFPDGSRKVTHVAEVVGMEGDVITMQEIFRFEQRSVDREGTVIGEIRPTGIRPRFSDRLRAAGVSLPTELFASAIRWNRPEQEAGSDD